MRPLFYARFRADRLTVRLVGTDLFWEDSPDVAIDTSTSRVLAIGREAKKVMAPAAKVINGFQSEHSVIDDIEVAEITLLHAIGQLQLRREAKRRVRHPLRNLFERKPDVVVHPLVLPVRGLSQLEVRGLECLLAGEFRKVYVWIGPELSDADLRNGAYRPRWVLS